MRKVGSFEAKTHFSQLLAAVALGEKIAITKHGQKVAMLVPIETEEVAPADSAIQAIKKLIHSIPFFTIITTLPYYSAKKNASAILC